MYHSIYIFLLNFIDTLQCKLQGEYFFGLDLKNFCSVERVGCLPKVDGEEGKQTQWRR